MALPRQKTRTLTPGNDTEETVLGGERAKERKDEIVHLNFKVPREFRKRFKRRANEDDVSQLELLRRAFDAYEEHA